VARRGVISAIGMQGWFARLDIPYAHLNCKPLACHPNPNGMPLNLGDMPMKLNGMPSWHSEVQPVPLACHRAMPPWHAICAMPTTLHARLGRGAAPRQAIC
jgi:hypothetical protein